MKHLTTALLAAAAAAAVTAGVASGAASRHSYMEDRAEVENLIARYVFAMDWGDADAYAGVFTEDAVLDYAGGVLKGRPAIHEFIVASGKRAAERLAKEPGKRPVKTRHVVTNMLLEVHGDRAISKAYWTEISNQNDDRKPMVLAYGHYEDEERRVNGRWLFSRRKVYNELFAPRAAGPENPLPH